MTTNRIPKGGPSSAGQAPALSDRTTAAARVPRHVSLFSILLQFLLRAGVPLGFNALVTIRGRMTGRPRTVGLALIEVDGRRWVWAPWGDVHWVRNLRASGRAAVEVRRHRADVLATELDEEGRVAFFANVLAPLARSIPFGPTFVRVVDGVDLGDPIAAAHGRCVFELRPIE